MNKGEKTIVENLDGSQSELFEMDCAGYATVEIEGECLRAAFFRDTDVAGRPDSWGLRMWNGRGQQMMTVFFPGPWYDRDAGKFRKDPDWSQLELWMGMRERYTGVPAEEPPPSAERPRMH